ncbi:MAG: hypothetical protein R3C29_03110 [Dehalococcoidia bacterium]
MRSKFRGATSGGLIDLRDLDGTDCPVLEGDLAVAAGSNHDCVTRKFGREDADIEANKREGLVDEIVDDTLGGLLAALAFEGDVNVRPAVRQEFR